jgi:hypothetical protein
MARISRSLRFFRTAEAALLASIELYNKPAAKEAFAILALNAWELLLKAKLLAENRNRHVPDLLPDAKNKSWKAVKEKVRTISMV